MPIGVPNAFELCISAEQNNYFLFNQFAVFIVVFFVLTILWAHIEVTLTSVTVFNKHTVFNNFSTKSILDFVNSYLYSNNVVYSSFLSLYL